MNYDMNYERLLIDNIYVGGPIPTGCKIVKINNDLSSRYYGHCVRGKNMLVKPVEGTIYVLDFTDSNGVVLRVSGVTPKLTKGQYTTMIINHFNEDLFIL